MTRGAGGRILGAVFAADTSDFAHIEISDIRNDSDGWSTTNGADPTLPGITPGWRQSPSANPIRTGPSPVNTNSESGPTPIDSKNFDVLNSRVFWQLWRELGREVARDRAKRSLDLSSRGGQNPKEYVEALRLANSASLWFLDETMVRLARCAALLRLDRLDEAKIDLQREHFYS